MIETIIATFFLYALWKLHLGRKRLEEERFEEIAEEFMSNIITIEKVYQSGSYTWLIYTYQETPVFLAQGKTEDEAKKNLISMFPGREFYQLQEKV